MDIFHYLLAHACSNSTAAVSKLLKFAFLVIFITAEPIQPVQTYMPGSGLNAIQEDSEQEEKENSSRRDSDASREKGAVPAPLAMPPAEPHALSIDDINILSK